MIPSCLVSAGEEPSHENRQARELAVSNKNVEGKQTEKRSLPVSQDVVKSFKSMRWLNDASITFAYTRLERRLSKAFSLAPSILLMEPAAAFWLAVVDDPKDLREAKKALKLQDRKLLLCPINDSRNGRADSGSHWSLLVGWRCESGGDGRWEFVHYDSLASSSRSRQCAKQLAARLQAGVPNAVLRGACAQQSNCFDCGMYVISFTEMIVHSFLEANQKIDRAKAAAVPDMWHKRLLRVDPIEITERRRRYHQLACEAFESESG